NRLRRHPPEHSTVECPGALSRGSSRHTPCAVRRLKGGRHTECACYYSRYTGCSVSAGTAAGSQMVNLVPRPRSLCTSIRPPCACTILRTVASPSPLPPGLVV